MLLRNIAESRPWHTLMHYKRRGILGILPQQIGGVKSEVDGESFFFSKEGKTDPYLELRATIEAFYSPVETEVGKLKQHPQCAYPERFRFLMIQSGLLKHFSDRPLPSPVCTKLREFEDRLKPAGISLVFSSAYSGNAGSMFGHTFLKIKSKASMEGKTPDLLDHGLGYAATVSDDENGFAFVLNGLFGGYIGQFSIAPYYAKVTEYNHGESRDLWEYDLSLSPEESLRLIHHAWELESNSYLDYYFTDENCSYQMMTLLEAIKPEWDLSGFTVHAIPAETIRVLSDIPGAIKGYSFRPSLRRKLSIMIAGFTPEQRKLFHRLINAESTEEFSSVEDGHVLDVVNQYFFFRQKNEREVKQEVLKAALLQRSKLPAKSKGSMDQKGQNSEGMPSKEWLENERPDFGHKPFRVALRVGSYQGGEFGELGYRVAYHDLFNYDAGYLPFSQIEFPQFALRYVRQPIGGGRKLSLSYLGAVTTFSYFPIHSLEQKLSWEFGVDYYTPKDFGCENCHAARLFGGVGGAVGFFEDDGLVAGLVTARVEGGESLEKGYRILPGIKVQTLGKLVDRLKVGVGGKIENDFLSQLPWLMSIKAESAYAITRNFEARVSWDRYYRRRTIKENHALRKNYSEWIAGFSFYY